MEDPAQRVPDLENLESARLLSGLGRFEMWVRYFSLGGQASPLELDAFFHDSMIFTDSEYNIVVHALNERLQEVGIPSLLTLRSVGPPPGLYESARSKSKSVREDSDHARSEAIEMRISALEMRDAALKVHQLNRAVIGKLKQQRDRFAAQAQVLGIELP